jgi:hypothetical protein
MIIYSCSVYTYVYIRMYVSIYSYMYRLRWRIYSKQKAKRGFIQSKEGLFKAKSSEREVDTERDRATWLQTCVVK